MHKLPYSTAEIDTDLDVIAERIRANIRQVEQTFIVIGRDLILAKRKLGRGNFLPWVEKLGISDQTARNLMNAASFAARLPAGKSQMVLDLPQATLYRLAAPATPEEVKAGIVAAIEARKPISADDIEERIYRAEQKSRHAKFLEAEARLVAERRQKRKLSKEERQAIRDKAKAKAEAEVEAKARAWRVPFEIEAEQLYWGIQERGKEDMAELADILRQLPDAALASLEKLQLALGLLQIGPCIIKAAKAQRLLLAACHRNQ